MVAMLGVTIGRTVASAVPPLALHCHLRPKKWPMEIEYIAEGVIIEEVGQCSKWTGRSGPYETNWPIVCKTKEQSVPLPLGLATYCTLIGRFSGLNGKGRNLSVETAAGSPSRAAGGGPGGPVIAPQPRHSRIEPELRSKSQVTVPSGQLEHDSRLLSLPLSVYHLRVQL